jgi:uncharacterized lipoprotein YajG
MHGSDFKSLTVNDRIVAIVANKDIQSLLTEVMKNEAAAGNVVNANGEEATTADINDHDQGILNFLGVDLLDDRGWIGDLL